MSIHLVGSLLILLGLQQCTDQNSYGIKPGLHPLCTSNIRAPVTLLFECPLSSCREFFAGAIIINVAVTCTATLYSAGVARNNIDKGPTILVAGLHVLRFLSPDSSEPDGMTNKFQQLTELALGMSWDPGGRCTRPQFPSLTRFAPDVVATTTPT